MLSKLLSAGVTVSRSGQVSPSSVPLWLVYSDAPKTTLPSSRVTTPFVGSTSASFMAL
jgi:hypothetical protein